MRDLSLQPLRWAVGSFCAFAGALALVVPHHFEAPPFAALEPQLVWWGVLCTLAGGALLSAAAMPMPRPLATVAHLLAALALVVLAGGLALAQIWTAPAIYIPLILATAAAGLQDDRPANRPPRGDLFALAMGVGAALIGLLSLAAPAAVGAPDYDSLRPLLPWIGAALLVAGTGLAGAQLARGLPRSGVAGLHLLAAATLIAYALVTVAPARAWLGIAVFGGGGAIVAVLPWIGPRLRAPRAVALRTVLALSLTVGVVVPVVLLAAVVGERAEEAEIGQMLEAQQALARVLADDVASYVSLHHAPLGLLASRSGLLEMPADRQRRTLSTLNVTYPEFRSLAIVDAQGTALAGTTLGASGFAGLPAFEEVARTNAPSITIGWSPAILRPVLGFASPIRGQGGEFRGAVIGVVESTHVVDLLARANLGAQGTAFLVNAAGRVIAHEDRALMESFADLSGSPSVAELIAGGPTEGSLTYPTRRGGVLAAWARVPGLRWGVAIELPKADALVASRTEREGTFGIVMLVGALIAALAVIVAGRIASPLSGLAAAASELAAGNATAPLPRSRIQEIGQLAAAFGHMRAELAERSAQLEARYEEIRVLHEFSQLALASGDPERIAQAILSRVLDLGRYDIGTVRLKDDAGGMKLVAAQGFRDPPSLQQYPRWEARGATGTIVEEDIQSSERARRFRAEGVEAAIVVPIVAGGETIGTLRVGSRTPRRIEPQDVRVLEAIGSQLGVVVQKASLLEGAQRAYAELKASEEVRTQLAATIEATPDLVAIRSGDRRHLYLNPAGRAMLGFAPDENLTGLSMGDMRPEWQRAFVLQEVLSQVQRFGVWTGELAYLARDGREIPVSSVLLAHRGVDGQIAFYSTIARDISRRKQAEGRLRRAERLEAAGLVAGQVAHDFNNLLGPLMGFPELIKMRLPENDPAVGYCDVMINAAREMAELNGDLLALGRRAHVEHEATDLNDLVREALASMEESSGISVRVELAADLAPVRGSGAQLLRVVNNLISNAREAMQGGGLLTVRTAKVPGDEPVAGLAGADREECVLLEVADTGPGIPEEVRDRIFDPFFSTRRDERRRGAGLGLSVVQSVVDDHEGFVDVVSEVGQGASFRVYLPTSKDSVKQKIDAAIPVGTETILVVDDDEFQRTATREMLGSLGYRVSTVTSGEAAVHFLREHPVDLLALDMVMPPGMDGVETYRRILEIRPGQRAIVLSGFAESERVDQALALGAGCFLRKPVPLAQLAEAVRAELDRSVGDGISEEGVK